MRLFNAEKIRFLLVGGFNTISSYLIYVLLLQFFHYAIAYTASFILSIMISYFLNAQFVFRVKHSWRKFFTFPSVYFVQYFLGLGLLHVFIANFHVNALIAPLLVVSITFPISFILSRVILTHKKMVS